VAPPHRVNCRVTAGGLKLDSSAWVHSRPEFLLSHRVMAPLMRGKVVEGLRAAYDAGDRFVPGESDAARVTFNAIVEQAFSATWVIHVEAPNGRPADIVAK